MNLRFDRLPFAARSPRCQVAGEPAAAETSDLASFDGNPNRSCTQACATGTVCDTSSNACVAEPGAPQIAFPISGTVTTGLPEIRWSNASSASSSAIEICSDALCTHSITTLTGVDHASLASPLPRGTYFLRAWGLRNGVAGAHAAPTHVFRSSGRGVSSKSALAWFSDFDANGTADFTTYSNGDYQPLAGTRDNGPLTMGGAGSDVVAMPDMDGDGRTEVAYLRNGTTLVIARLAPAATPQGDPTVVQATFPVAAGASLLLLGDMDRDGFADLGITHPLADGVRLEVVYGGAGAAVGVRRRTVDVRMPQEYGNPTEFASVTALGDLDGDGYPDLALGGRTEYLPETPSGASTPTRTGDFLQGNADGYRIYVFPGGATQPFARALAPFVREGDPAFGLVPVGDVDGDGIVDAMAQDTRVLRYVGYEAITDNYYELRTHGYRGGFATLTFGGAAFRKQTFGSPSFVRSGPAASWATDGIANEYADWTGVVGIRKVANGRSREEYFFPTSLTGAGDVDGDGYFDIAFGSRGALVPAPLSGEAWDTFSTPNPERSTTTPPQVVGNSPFTSYWFAPFVDVRHGGPSGFDTVSPQYVFSPTVEGSPSLRNWSYFPPASKPTPTGCSSPKP